MYTGCSIGYVLITGSKIHKEGPNNLHAFYYTTSGNGISAGIPFGGTYYINKKVGLNAEVSANYMGLLIGDVCYNILAVPVTVGIRYKL